MAKRNRCTCSKGDCSACACAEASRKCADECACGRRCTRKVSSLAVDGRGSFPQSQKEQIYRLARYKCGNPDCLQRDCGRNFANGDFELVGEVAHIHAAAAGGPRYDASMSEEDRNNAFKNGILLCCNCHTLVDKRPAHYTATLLFEWKRAVEAREAKPAATIVQYVPVASTETR